MPYNVDLHKIYEKITLSDLEFAEYYISDETMIINLSEKELANEKNNNFIFNLKLSDSYIPQSYDYFKDVMQKCIELIDIAKGSDYPVIVNCTAGVNRSCSAIIAYMIVKQGISVDEAIDYIRAEKRKKYPNKRWSTLTNTKFVEYLKRMKEELTIKSIQI